MEKMEKHFNVERYGGTMVSCKIVLIKDARTDSFTATDPVWHEEYKRNVSVHKCCGFIGDNIERIVLEFKEWDPAQIEKVVTDCDIKLRNIITFEDSIASHKQETEEVLKKLGFKMFNNVKEFNESK